MKPPAVAYLWTMVAVIAAVISRRLLDPLVGDNVPFVTLFAAVSIAAWIGGIRTAVLATMVGGLLAWYFIVPPRFSFLAVSAPNLLGLLLFAAVGVVIGLFGQSMHNARHRTETHREALRITLNSIGDGVITTDREGIVTGLNPVAESLTGWIAREAIGKPLETIFRIVNETTREPVANPAYRALHEGIIVGLANHTILIAKNGREQAIDDSAAPIRDNEGQLVGSVLVFRDVGERRQAERTLQIREARHRAIIETALDCIITINHEGKIVEFNPAAERTFGFRRDEVLGCEMAELIVPPARRSQHRQGLACYLATGHGPILDQRLEMSAINKDGTEFPVELAVCRIQESEQPLFTAYLRDISEQKALEHQIAERNAATRFLAAIVESSDDAIISKALDGTIQSWNAAAERLFGYSAEDAIGRSITMLIPPERLSEEEQIISSIRAGKAIDHFDTVRVRKDGKAIAISLTVSPIHNESGQIIGASKIARDISEHIASQTRLRESEERFRTLIEQVQEHAIFGIDHEGRATTWNEGVQRVLGFDESEFIGSDVLSLIFTPEDVQLRVPQKELAQAAANGSAGDDRWMQRKDGTRFWAAGITTARRDDNGALIGFTKVMRDMTHQKKLQDELRQLAADLSEADRRKDEFLATLAHELRNPLAPIRNGLQLMRLAKDDAAMIDQVRQMMERQLLQLIHLVDDLLDVSRITRGRLELRKERVELATVIRNSIEASRPQMEELGHTLTTQLPHEPIVLEADPTRLAQILLNLLNNAVKYTDRGGKIWLEVTRDENEVVMIVRDTGIGIDCSQLTRIFDMFSQVDPSLEKSQGGLGIGLTLVKKLVELHGGTITATSEGRGKGSQFTVRLPIVSSTALSSSTQVQVVKSMSRRILVVDDNRDNADSLSRMLVHYGNETQVAYDGLEAIERARSFRPDVILLDIGLPKLNGYETCRLLRAEPWGKNAVLIAVTGWGQQEDRRRSEEAGFDWHFVKPVDPTTLMRLLAGNNE